MSTRFLLVHPGPQFSVHDIFTGWLEALRALGVSTATFNLGDRLAFYEQAMFQVEEGTFRKACAREQAFDLAVNGLYAALYKVNPDVLVIVSGFFIPVDLLDLARSRGARVVIVHTEQPYELGRELGIAAHADLNLINDPTNIEAFRTVAPTVYVPHSYRPTVHAPGPPDPKLAADLAFVGTGYASRIAFLEAMDLNGLDVLLAGNWRQLAEGSTLRGFVAHEPDECLDNEQTVQVYRSARVGLNLYRREAEAAHLAAGVACGPREIEMAACGMFFLRDPRTEGDELFPMLPTFTDPEDASEQLRYWIDKPDKRRELALQAREAVAARTFTNRAAELLRLLERTPS